MIYNESLRSTKKKKKTNKIAEWDFKNKVLIRCMAYFAQCSTRNIPIVENAKSSRITLHVWLMALAAVTRIPSSAARTIQFHHYQSALPPPATPVFPLSFHPPPYPCSTSAVWWRRVAHSQRFIFIAHHSNSIQFISLGFPSRRRLVFFFKILIFGHKCGGLAIVHGFGFPIRQQRHFHQDQAKLPRRFWPLALWPIGLCYGWAKARHQKKIYMPSRKSGSQNILMYDSSQETKRYEN